MEDEQLLEHSPQEARQKFSDEQLERYNELKEQELQEGIEEQKEKDAENAVNGLEAMRRQAEGDLTVEVYGIEFVADVNPRQVKQLKKLERFEDRSPEDLDDDEFESVHDNFLQLLSELSVNHDREDWDENFGDAGVMTLAQITGNLLSKIDVEVEQKKSR
jgi:hypothetical protein